MVRWNIFLLVELTNDALFSPINLKYFYFTLPWNKQIQLQFQGLTVIYSSEFYKISTKLFFKLNFQTGWENF